jgi:formylglycine-generating enzyme required for sulfatase activity
MTSPAVRLLGAQLDQARAQTDALFSLLDPAALYDRPVADRHRLVFYLGHVEAFDWNLLSARALDKPSFHPAFDKLFAFGIDPDPGRAPADRPSDWPSETEVRDYCARVRRALDESLHAAPDQLLHVAIEHRLMHAETLAYLIHNLPRESKRGAPPQVLENRPAVNSMLEIPAGEAVLGQLSGGAFGWDNEFERHSVQVPAFRISRFKISNGEYLEYLRAAGAAAHPPHLAHPPHFWIERDGRWFLRAMFAEIPLPVTWPVFVTQQQATAYAQWRSGVEGRNFALPSEAQFHRAAEGASPLNADFERWDPVPASLPGGESRHGVAGLIGNGWEWTSTVFGPLDGFQPFPFYPGYSADFFDGKHFVLKGGSPRTGRALLRSSFRNWFRADYPYLYAGFRLAENASSL